MHKTSNTFFVLQATAAVVATAILLWSLGLSSIRFAEAANVTEFSDTLSTTEPSVAADHTIVFTTPTGVANGDTITLDFSDGPFVVGAVDFTDIDVATTSGEFTLAADCTGSEMASAAFSGTTLTITMCSGDGSSIAAYGTTTIQIGTNADGGNAQLTNPVASGGGNSYELLLTAGASDTGSTRIAILDVVTVTASVDTYFQFTVTGVQGGQTVNGTTTGATTTATSIPFGTLEAGVASTGAQDLSVVTNSKNGFTVTVVSDGQLESLGGADIDSFVDGGNQSTPIAWTSPTPTVGLENTYGHWGITSDDTDYFGSGEYVAASTTPVQVFSYTGPTDGTVTGQGTTRVGYTAEITGLQEAADDYQAILTYIATPVF